MKMLLIVCLCVAVGNAFAQSSEKEPAAIVELGGAASHGLTGEGASFGPNVAVEVTPLENWLEIETGVTPLFTRHSTEWDTDLIFQEALDLVQKSGVHGWHRAGVDSF